MAESDGKVVYEVRADLSKIDSDLSAADRKVTQASEKTAKKQEDAQKGVVKTTKQANSDIAKDTEKTQKELSETVKKESEKAATHFKKNANEMSQSGKKAAEEVESSVTGMASSIIGKIGKVAAAAASVKTLVSTMKLAIGEAVSAETSFAKVNTLLSDDADRTAYFNDIKNASRSTGVVVSDLSEAVYSALSASVDEDSAVDFTQNAVKLAKGGFTDTATAVDVLTTTLNAYELEASEATRISDIFITTQNEGKTTVGELASSLGQTIPVANGAGTAIEDLATQYAIMTKNGVATAESGTQIKAMLNELNASGTNVSDTLKELTGKSFKDLQNSGKNTAEILKILKDHAEANNLSISDLFGSVEAGAAAFTLVRDGGADFIDILDQMKNSAGATEKAYNTMANTTEERFNKLKNNLMIAVEEIGEKLLPSIENFFEFIDENSEELGEMIEGVGGAISELLKIAVEAIKVAWEHKDVILAIVSAMIAYKAALAIEPIVTQLKTSVQSLSKAQDTATDSTKKLNNAISPNPWALAAAAVATFIVKLTGVISTATSCSDEVQRLVDSTNSLKNNMENSISSAEADMTILKNKADRYEELRQKIKLTFDEELELKGLSKDLKAVLGDSCDIINSLTGEYNDLTDAVENYISKHMAEVELKAYESLAVEAIQKMDEIKAKKEEIENSMYSDAWNDSASKWYNWIIPSMVSMDYNAKVEQSRNDLNALDEEYTYYSEAYAKYQELYTNSIKNSTEVTDENSDSKNDNTEANNENAESVKNLAKSYTDVQSALEQTKSKYDILTAATEEANSTGALSVTTLKNIASAYPQLQDQIDKYLAGLIDEQELLKEMSDAYDEDQQNYYKYLLVKLGYSEDFVESALNGSDIIADYFMENYKIDLKNYKDYISRKQAIQEAFDSYLAGGVSAWWTEESGWSEKFQYLKPDAQKSIMNIVNQYQDAMTDLDSWGEQQSTEQFQADFAKIKERTYNTLNANSNGSSSSSSSSGSGNSSNSSSTSGSSGGQTISITSYIPTMWDEAAKANQKLIAGGVAASLVGDSKSGKLISGLTSNAAAAVKSTGSTDASLNDVVKAIKGLEQSNSEIQCIVTSILNVDSVALARQTIKGVATIEKTTGRKVF